jgi:hypothetical protein
MPKLISALIAIVVGYLEGAGLGAVLYGFAGHGADKEINIVLVAGLAAGPLGALLGLLLARTQSPAAGAKP